MLYRYIPLQYRRIQPRIQGEVFGGSTPSPIFKEIRHDFDEEFKEIFSYAEASMIAGNY